MAGREEGVTAAAAAGGGVVVGGEGAAAAANGDGVNAVESQQQPIVEAVGVPIERMDDDVSSLPYDVSLQDNMRNHNKNSKYRNGGGGGAGAAGGGDIIEEHDEDEAFDYYDEEIHQLRAVRRRNVLIIVMLLVFLGLVVAISVGIGKAVVANKKSTNGSDGGNNNALVGGEGGGGSDINTSIMPSSFPSIEGPCIPIEFGIIFDQYPEETGWFLVKGEYDPENPPEENDILWSSKYYDPLDYAEHSDTFDNCVMPGTYTFVFTDEESDGVCCYHGQGSYILSSEGQIISIGGEMESTEDIIVFDLPFEEPEPVDTDGDGMDDRLGWMMPITSSNLTEGIDCENFHLVILTDKYGIETTWELYEGTDKAGTMIANGGPYGSEYTYVVDYCLPSPKEYVLYVYDWDRRGLCCASGEGMYRIVSGDILIYESDGQFGEVNITQFTLPADGSAVFTDEPRTSIPSLTPAPTLLTRPPKSPTASPSESPKPTGTS